MGGAVDVCVGKICPPAVQMANSTQRAAVRKRTDENWNFRAEGDCKGHLGNHSPRHS